MQKSWTVEVLLDISLVLFDLVLLKNKHNGMNSPFTGCSAYQPYVYFIKAQVNSTFLQKTRIVGRTAFPLFFA